MEPRALQRSVQLLARQLGLGEIGAFERVESVWGSAAGRLSTAATPSRLRGRSLVVTVADPALVEALRWESLAIAARLEDALGERLVDEVTATIAPR
jgi:hypothetical protein